MGDDVSARSLWIRGVTRGLWTWRRCDVLFAGDWFGRLSPGMAGRAAGHDARDSPGCEHPVAGGGCGALIASCACWGCAIGGRSPAGAAVCRGQCPRCSGRAGAMIDAIGRLPGLWSSTPRTWQRASPNRCHRAAVQAQIAASRRSSRFCTARRSPAKGNRRGPPSGRAIEDRLQRRCRRARRCA
jgi:hypothetical protein